MRFKNVVALLAIAAAPALADLRDLPPNAIWLMPARTTLIPDNASLRRGESRAIRKGEALFAFSLVVPSEATIGEATTVSLADRSVQLQSGSTFEPFAPITQGREASVKIYCSATGSAATAFAKAELQGTGADKPRLCLIDGDHSGVFNAAMLDAVFPDGVVPAGARRPSPITAIPYMLHARSKGGFSGDYELYFRDFPIQGDRLTVALRRRGTANSRPIANLLIDNGSGYVNYYSSYSFVRYNRQELTTVEIMGVTMTIEEVDRENAVIHAPMLAARPGTVFTVNDYGNYVPFFRDFDGGQVH